MANPERRRSAALGACVVAAVMAAGANGPSAAAEPSPYAAGRASVPGTMDSLSGYGIRKMFADIGPKSAPPSCPNSQVWVGYLGPDPSQGPFADMPDIGGDYDNRKDGAVGYLVGRAWKGRTPAAVVVACFAGGGSPRYARATSGFVIEPDASVTVCSGSATASKTPFSCR